MGQIRGDDRSIIIANDKTEIEPDLPFFSLSVGESAVARSHLHFFSACNYCTTLRLRGETEREKKEKEREEREKRKMGINIQIILSSPR